MSHVDIDDYECPICGKLGSADLNLKTGIYTCSRCLNKKNRGKDPFKKAGFK